MNKTMQTRQRFIREYQLKGGTYTEACEIWQASEEIADTFSNDGINVEEDLSEGDIKDAIADWKLLRRMGL